MLGDGLALWVAGLPKAPAVSLGKKLYPYYLVLVSSRNGFMSDFRIKIKLCEGLMIDWHLFKLSFLVKYSQNAPKKIWHAGIDMFKFLLGIWTSICFPLFHQITFIWWWLIRLSTITIYFCFRFFILLIYMVFCGTKLCLIIAVIVVVASMKSEFNTLPPSGLSLQFVSRVFHIQLLSISLEAHVSLCCMSRVPFGDAYLMYSFWWLYCYYKRNDC